VDYAELEQDAYGIDTFCKRNEISRSYLYLLWKRGDGPRYMQVGSRRLITREAGAVWRHQMEQRAEGPRSCEVPRNLETNISIPINCQQRIINKVTQHASSSFTIRRTRNPRFSARDLSPGLEQD